MDRLDLPKDHSVDGYAISLSDRINGIVGTNVTAQTKVYQYRRFKKKSGGNIAARNQRVYMYNGEAVAYNRHKAMSQKKDSLEEYMGKYASTHTEDECAEHFRSLEIVPAKRTYTFHKAGLRAPAHPGDIVRYEKHNKVKGNTKTNTFVATSVAYKQESDNSRQWHIDYGTASGNYKAKFCRPIGSGSIQLIGSVSVAEAVAIAEKQAAKAKKRREAAKLAA